MLKTNELRLEYKTKWTKYIDELPKIDCSLKSQENKIELQKLITKLNALIDVAAVNFQADES